MHNSLIRSLLLTALSAFVLLGCDPEQYPPGLSNIRNAAGPMTATRAPNGTVVSWTTTSMDDNPELLAYTKKTSNFWFFWFAGSENCDPISSYTNCMNFYGPANTAGRDLIFAQRTSGTLYAAFPTGMRPVGSGTTPEAVFKQQYTDTGWPVVGALPQYCADPSCANVTWPTLWKKMHLPLDAQGRVQSVTVDVVQQINGASTMIGRLKVNPSSDLLVVPVHVHYWTNETSLSERQTIANSFVDRYDDRGAAEAVYDSTQDRTFARLWRPVNAILDEETHENGLAECNVQLRLSSVQFHPRPASLLVNSNVVANVGNGAAADCSRLLNDTPNVSAGVRFSPIGAELRRFFANVPDGVPQGIHVAITDRIENGAGAGGQAQGDAGGFGCAGTGSGASFAVVTHGTVSLQIHEAAHALGLGEPGVDRLLVGTAAAADCVTVRQQALRIINLAD